MESSLVGKQFQTREIVGLDAESFARLLFSGTIDLDSGDPSAGVGLAYDRGRSSFFFEFDPENDLSLFLQHCRLVRWVQHEDPPRCTLSLISTDSLESILLSELESFETSMVTTSDVESFFDGVWPNDKTPPPDDCALVVLRESASFRGMLGYCYDCTPGCEADYAWIEQDVCLFHLNIVAVGISNISLFPFRFER